MKLLKLLPLIASITCHTEALPDTNIQIQHYDGPVYLGTPSSNCCPFCNSILQPQTDNGNETPSTLAPEIVYPTVYGNNCENIPVTTAEITISVDPKEAKVTFDNNPEDGKNYRKTERSFFGSEIGNYGSMLHNNNPKTIHNIPVTCTTTPGTYGNTYRGTGIGCTRSPYGIASPTDADCSCGNPLSNYLPINTASQNTCYQLPIHTSNSNCDEPVLVPQKFMYSFILDGDVGSNQNGCDSKLYYY